MEALTEKLKLSKVLEKLWIHLMVDFIVKLLLIARKDVILVVCNRLSKIVHFVATIEDILVEGLARLFRDNIWKLCGLLESIVLNGEPQFAANLTKELNRMLEIETKLLTLFHLQTDKQTNQKLEQYLWFFINHKQKDWPEWLASAEFTVNNKVHLVMKISLFMVNYRRELRMGVDIRKKGKMEKTIEFSERMKEVQKKARVALKRA